MPVVLKIGRFKVSVNANDHAPPHAHVSFRDKEVVIDLTDLTVMFAKGVNGSDLKAILRAVAARQDDLAAAWREYHD